MYDEIFSQSVDIDSLRFYFDSQEKNLIDKGRWNYRSGAVLTLRRKLLTLQDREFDNAIEAIDRIVTPSADLNRDMREKRERDEFHKDGASLYNAVNDSAGVAASTGDEVSKI